VIFQDSDRIQASRRSIMTTAMPTLPISIEQLAIAIRQINSADRRRLLELAPELREAAAALPRTLQEARASIEYTRVAARAAWGNERLSPDTPFLGALTLGQYLNLPDDRRAQLWDTWASLNLADSEEQDA
jgi:hypothetical protein